MVRSIHISVLVLSVWLCGCHSVPDNSALPTAERVLQAQVPPLAVLETFLGHLAAGQINAAYKLVAPSSKENGDPIAYHAALDYASFLKELQPPKLETWGEGSDQPSGDIRDKFKNYETGNSRWETKTRFRVFITCGKSDTDEVLLVYERGQWYVADPVHIIR